jgi:NADH:ubiquinone oxidoreductase subunit H
VRPSLRTRPSLLAIAVFVGIVIPGCVLAVFAFGGWDLPAWLAVALPIVLIGSVRGTLILLASRALRWFVPRLRAWRSKSPAAKADVTN